MMNHQILHLMLVSSLRNTDRLMVFEQDDLVNLVLNEDHLVSTIYSNLFSIHQDIQSHSEILHLPSEFAVVQEYFDCLVQNINAFEQAIRNY